MKTVEVGCKTCKSRFTARVADRKRGGRMKQSPQIVNLVNVTDWGKAEKLKPIMEKMVYPQMRTMSIPDLLMFSFLAGIHVIVEAQEKKNDK